MSQSRKLIAILDPIAQKSHIYYGRLAAELRTQEESYDLIAVDNMDILEFLPVDGVLYRDEIESDRTILEKLQNKGISIVVLNSRDGLFPSINSDFEAGTIEAIKHFKELGRTNIAYIKGRKSDITAAKRFEAFKSAIAENGLKLNENLVTEGAYDYKITRDAATNLLRRRKEVDAVMCCSDRAANGVVNAAKHLGLRVPEDVAVVGLGNFPEFIELAEHPLSTVVDPIYINGYQAVSKLIRRIESRDTESDIEKVKTHLVIRQTTIGPEFSESLIEATATKDGGSLNFILCVGASLSEAKRKELKQLSRAEQMARKEPVSVIREVI